jgi:hypothetical protein
MNCLVPIWLPETSEQAGMYVPCGKCYNCLQKRRSVWTFRMLKENEVAESSYFVTLTYDEENIPYIDQWGFSIGSLYKPDLTNFFKKLRQNITKYAKEESRWFKTIPSTGKLAPKIRYFACGEYGELGDRPHYHIILWNLPDYFVDYDPIHDKMYSEFLEMTWDKGIVDIGEVNRASCHYVAKYTLDPLVSVYGKYDDRVRPYATMSRKPGIGVTFVNEQTIKHYIRTLTQYELQEGNIKQPLGRYIREKMYEGNVSAMRESKYKAVTESEKARDKEYKKITNGLSRSAAIERYEEFKRTERKEKARQVRKLNKGNKL